MKNHVKSIAAGVSILFVVLAAFLMWKSHNAPALDLPGTIDPLALQHENKATEYVIQHKYSQAVEEYRKSLQIQPNPNIQIQLGVTLVRAGRREEGIEMLREVAQNSGPAGPDAKIILDKVESNPNLGTGNR